MNNRIRAGLMTVLLACAAPHVFAANEWQPRLEPLPTDQFRGPTTPFAIRIPAEVPLETLQRLALELDTIDVTQFIDNSRAPVYVFTPVQALSYGAHQLRLVEYTPEGDIIERGVWDVEVRKSQAFREATLNANGNLDLARQIANNDSIPDEDRNSASGSLTLDAQAANGGWRGTAHLPLVFDDAADRKADVADFLFTSTQGAVTVQAGHHNIPSDSLVASSIYNRGISATATTTDQGQSVTGFVMHSSPISGARDGLGIGDTNDRVDGVVWTGYPVRANGRYVELSVAYVDGKGPDDGSGALGDPTVTNGTAWSLSADAGWKNNRYRLRGEYAGSKYDFDGSGGFDPEKDNATSVLFTYRPWDQKIVDNQPMDLALNIEHRRIGPFFATPAGQSPTSDRDLLRTSANFAWAALRIDAALSQEDTNVDSNNLLPTDRTDLASLAFNYSPLPSNDTQNPYGPWGQPNYSLTLTNQKIKTRELPASYSGNSVDNSTDTLHLGADFTHQRWNWGIAYDTTDFNDATNFESDTRDANTDVRAMFSVSDTVTLSPHVQVGRRKYKDTDVTSRTDLSGVNVTYNPTERWQTYVNLDVNRERVSDDSIDTRTKTITAGITWMAIPSTTNRPGVNLTLDGSKTDMTDNIDPAQSTDRYQIFFRVSVGWSALY